MRPNNHLSSYLEVFAGHDPRGKAVTETYNSFIRRVVKGFSHRDRVNGLLFGEVQSGKTSHTFGILAATADEDEGFRTFVYLSTDNVSLQEQTLIRGIQDLSETFDIIGESDELRFKHSKVSRPCLIVLKKNVRVLEKWLQILKVSDRVTRGPLFIVDDEGDAASPNTKVNVDDESEIYKKIQAMRELGTSSVFLQVTATPQALFLQQQDQGLRPEFIQYFEPGQDYLGGDFYFSKVDTARNIIIEEDDLDRSLEAASTAEPGGLQKCLMTFLVTSTIFKLRGDLTANALVHPSVNTGKHHEIAKLARLFYGNFRENLHTPENVAFLRSTLDDLNRTLEKNILFSEVFESLENDPVEIQVKVMNSSEHSDKERDFSKGFNLIVGGNTLGRGVTFPKLQTVYYTRQAKVPQADTFWQHARMFGYDRDKTLIRLFMPLGLFILFKNLFEANSTLFSLVRSGEIERLQVILPKNIRPTRKNVIRSTAYSFLVGGTSYFPAEPDQENLDTMDSILDNYNDRDVHQIDLDLAKSLAKLASKDPEWPASQFGRAMESMSERGIGFRLVTGRNRDIGRTGTMLTEQDRALGNQLGKDFVITAYRVKGSIEKRWAGGAFWLVNIRIPDGYVYHQVT